MEESNIDHFKMEVRKFEQLEKEIKKLTVSIKPHQDKLKELKKQKSDLQTNICGFMKTNEIGECKLQEGALLFKESKSVVPLNKEMIRNNMLKYFKENLKTEKFKQLSAEELTTELFNFVYDNREYSEKTGLKRVN